ncbi:class I SAM-dependent methyltransferase [Pseudomonas sp. N040]|nr:class I SAM-dependent methyltransferase [Pseudomonas sp. N040]MBF7729749.1 class I SAM-dependent methyltransferase [Pseudomonas sp. N040]MBW7013391.1 class I SAM-dependent methyltransferase [Pseudomonas sp. N040]
MHTDAITRLQQHLRSALDPAPGEARRLLHGRGRRWPGLEQISVDWLQGILLVTLFRQPEPGQLAALEAMLPSLGQPVLLQHRYRPDCPAEWLAGAPLSTWQIDEDGLRYQLDLGNKQNSGLFLDMRYGRRWVRQQAAGKTVLNLFAYTCGFSIAAIAGGARQVVNLDMARAALSRGRDNHRLNQHDLSRVSFLAHDLFKSWGKVKRLGPFDLIIVDPPSLQKGSFVLSSDYPKILRRLPDLLNQDGLVLACCNDPDRGSAFLLDAVAREAPGLVFRERLENPPEFADIDPECGLKALVFQRTAQAGLSPTKAGP